MKIIRIIRSKIRNKDKIKDEFYHRRMKICKECPLYSDNLVENKNLKYWFFKILNLNENFCTICGCESKAKASEELESCPEGKWGRED